MLGFLRGTARADGIVALGALGVLVTGGVAPSHGKGRRRAQKGDSIRRNNEMRKKPRPAHAVVDRRARDRRCRVVVWALTYNATDDRGSVSIGHRVRTCRDGIYLSPPATELGFIRTPADRPAEARAPSILQAVRYSSATDASSSYSSALTLVLRPGTVMLIINPGLGLIAMAHPVRRFISQSLWPPCAPGAPGGASSGSIEIDRQREENISGVPLGQVIARGDAADAATVRHSVSRVSRPRREVADGLGGPLHTADRLLPKLGLGCLLVGGRA